MSVKLFKPLDGNHSQNVIDMARYASAVLKRCCIKGDAQSFKEPTF